MRQNYFLKNHFQFHNSILNIPFYMICIDSLSGNSSIQPSVDMMPGPAIWVATVIPKPLKRQVQVNQAEIKYSICKGMPYSDWILKPWLMTIIVLLMALKELALRVAKFLLTSFATCCPILGFPIIWFPLLWF